jgi:hypothetical protein
VEIEDAHGLNEVSKIIARLSTLRNMSVGIAQMIEEGVPSNILASLVKDMGTKLEQEIAEIARLIITVVPSTLSDSLLAKFMAQSILHSPGFTLRGGTTEILRGIVAKGVIR